MKRILLAIILLLPLLAPAQEYVPFPTKNTVWSEYFFSDYILQAKVYHYFALKDNDTIIHKLEYHKLYCSFDTVFTEDELCGGLREEDKRVYYYSMKCLGEEHGEILNAPIPVDSEIILYDFNLQSGDTITSDVFRLRGYINKMIVSDFDSILVGGRYRKQYNFVTEYGTLFTFEHWVEGVGNLHGLLSDTGGIPTSNWNSWLICMIEGDEVLYHDSQFGSCYNENTNSVQLLENKSGIKATPNPAGSKLKVDFGDNNYQRLILSDLSGRPVRQYLVDGLKTLTIEREGLTKGTYLLSAYDRAGSLQTLKILLK